MYKAKKFTDLIIVVFPTPGGPMSNKEDPSWIKSLSKTALPEMALPTRQVRPIIIPFRFLMALIRCNVLLMPALLSVAKSPTCNAFVQRSWQCFYFWVIKTSTLIYSTIWVYFFFFWTDWSFSAKLLPSPMFEEYIVIRLALLRFLSKMDAKFN